MAKFQPGINKAPTHFDNGERKPLCTPNTKATKFTLSADAAKVTCKRCLATMLKEKSETKPNVQVAASISSDQVTPTVDPLLETIISTPKPCLAFDRSRYITHEEVTENGTHVVDVDDKVAEMLRGLTLVEAYQKTWNLAATGGSLELGSGKTRQVIYSVEELQDRYSKRNRGMQRMNLGNILRGIFGKGIKSVADENEDENQ